MGMSDYLKNKLLDAEWNNTSFAVAQVYVQLHTGDPGAGTDNQVSIARQAASVGAASTGGVTSDGDLAYASMPACTVTHVSTWDAAGSGTPPTGGNLLRTQALTAPYAVTAGATFRIATGDLQATK